MTSVCSQEELHGHSEPLTDMKSVLIIDPLSSSSAIAHTWEAALHTLRKIQKQLPVLQTSYHPYLELSGVSPERWHSSRKANRQLRSLRCSTKKWAQHQVHAVKRSSDLGRGRACAAACRPFGVSQPDSPCLRAAAGAPRSPWSGHWDHSPSFCAPQHWPAPAWPCAHACISPHLACCSAWSAQPAQG